MLDDILTQAASLARSTFSAIDCAVCLSGQLQTTMRKLVNVFDAIEPSVNQLLVIVGLVYENKKNLSGNLEVHFLPPIYEAPYNFLTASESLRGIVINHQHRFRSYQR